MARRTRRYVDVRATKYRIVPGTDGLYGITEEGELINLVTRGGSSAGYVHGGSISRDGYVRAGIMVRGRLMSTKLHRLVALTYLGPCPPNHEVHHKNGDRLDNRPCNLEYIGRRAHKAGAMNGRAKLNEDDVRAIRRLAGRMPKASIARLYGISDVQVAAIQSGEEWRYISQITPESGLRAGFAVR